MALTDLDFGGIIKHRHTGYVATVDHAKDMAVHIYGAKPEKILNRVRPRESEEVKKYRLESYEPITTATADKGITMVQKIMNPKLRTITFPEAGKDLEQYLFMNYPYYRSIMTFINDVLIRAMIGDPNGLVVVLPVDMSITDREKAQPVVDVVSSEKVWDYKFGEWYLIHRKTEKIAKSTVYFFHYIDKTSITYFYVEQSELNKLTYSIVTEYPHNIGEPPVWFLTGISTRLVDNTVMYRSFFSAAMPYWNKAVAGDSDLDGAFINHMHPIRVEVTEECGFAMDNLRCNGGKITKDDGKQYDCPSCFGTGRKSVKSPYGVYLVPKPGLGEQPNPIAPVSYVSIPTEPTVLLQDRVNSYLDKGLAALNMFFTVGENQSGIAKVLDRSELYDFLLTLSTVTFDVHLFNICYYTAHYRYMNKTEGKLPSIQKPTSFDLLTPQEDAVILNAAQEAGMDNAYIRAKMKNMIEKDLYGKPLEIAVATDALLMNPLAGYTSDEVINMLNSGLIEERAAVIYANINGIIQQLYADNPKFNSLSYDQKLEAVQDSADSLLVDPVTPDNTDGV